MVVSLLVLRLVVVLDRIFKQHSSNKTASQTKSGSAHCTKPMLARRCLLLLLLLVILLLRLLAIRALLLLRVSTAVALRPG